jgi:hypothetical protein
VWTASKASACFDIELVLHQSGARIDLDAQDFLEAMLAQATNQHPVGRQANDTVPSSQPDRGSASWHNMCITMDAHTISLTMRLTSQLIRQQRPKETPTLFVHNMRQTYNELNESCMLADGPVTLPEHLFNIFILVGMSHAGHLGQAKQCIKYAFDPNVNVHVSALTEHLLRHADHLDDPVGH